MIRFEKDKLIIEVSDPFPCGVWADFVFDLVRAVGILDKERVDNQNDVTYSLTRLIEEMLPEEKDMMLLTKAKGIS